MYFFLYLLIILRFFYFFPYFFLSRTHISLNFFIFFHCSIIFCLFLSFLISFSSLLFVLSFFHYFFFFLHIYFFVFIFSHFLSLSLSFLFLSLKKNVLQWSSHRLKRIIFFLDRKKRYPTFAQRLFLDTDQWAFLYGT